MPGWVPFTGLTLLVLALLLAIARLSQQAVDAQPALPEPSPDETGEGGTGSPIAEPVEADPAADGNIGQQSRQQTDTTPERELTTGMLLANVALTQGLFGAIIAAGAWYYEIPASALGLSDGRVETGVLALGVGVVFGTALWTANELGTAVADAVGATYDETLREMLAPDTYGGWALLLGLILPTIAVVEELIFRAALIGVPAAGFAVSPWVLAALSSVAFALGHGAQGRVGVAVTGGLGFVLATGYVLSGSLLVVVVAHYLVNALEFVVHER